MEKPKGKFKIGDPVHGHDKSYWPQHDCDNLVVLYADDVLGYGVGPEGNDPTLRHNLTEGWVYYYEEELTPR